MDVEFEWFDPNPDVDFLGIKALLRQLLDIDSQLFDLSALSDLILSQPLLGSTVKCDGKETDPYAFLTVLNLATHKDKPVIQQLTQYFSRQASRRSKELGQLPALLADGSEAQVGLILSDRFMNIPHEIVPPMYNMLQEEIQWAIDENEPYKFTHYLIISKTYIEMESQLRTDEQPRSKKSKAGGAAEPEVFYFHPEDEVLHKHAVGWANFGYETPRDEGSYDSKRVFQEMGVKPIGHMILLEASKFAGAVEAVQSYLGGGQ